ncbi:MAG: sugar phosphate nucleotidyltransferase [Phycisphaerales bacterium]
MRYAMIMAGGAGTRLWPMSRDGQPKQLIRFIHGQGPGPVSLIEVAAGRLEGVVPPERRYICTGERYRQAIREVLPEFGDEHLLGEPEGRDTLNAVGFAAAVFGKHDPDAVFAVLTADHLIDPQDVFVRAMETGLALVEADPTRLVTFGITPTYPATGFGYVEQGRSISGTGGLGFAVQRFVEKPPLPKAQAFFESGSFFWNAGMFVFHARTFMDLLERHAPDNFKGLTRIAGAWGTPEQDAVLNEVYPTLPKISVDYGVMEPASNDDAVSIVGVKMDVRWLDVGSWPSYGETLDPDGAGNRAAGVSIATHDARNNLVIGDGSDHTVALVGCKDLIVVRTDRATLVMPAERAQNLKTLHAGLPDELK